MRESLDADELDERLGNDQALPVTVGFSLYFNLRFASVSGHIAPHL